MGCTSGPRFTRRSLTADPGPVGAVLDHPSRCFQLAAQGVGLAPSPAAARARSRRRPAPPLPGPRPRPEPRSVSPNAAHRQRAAVPAAPRAPAASPASAAVLAWRTRSNTVGQRAGRVEVVVHGSRGTAPLRRRPARPAGFLAGGTRSTTGPAAGRSARSNRRANSSSRASPASASCDRVRGDLDRRAVVGPEHQQAVGAGVAAVQQVGRAR